MATQPATQALPENARYLPVRSYSYGSNESPYVNATFQRGGVSYFADRSGDLTDPVPASAEFLSIGERRCGDWYCEVRGDRFVATTGVTQIAAANAAFARLQAVSE